MNWIHLIDLLFFVVLPVGVMAYGIKYAIDDCKYAAKQEKEWIRKLDLQAESQLMSEEEAISYYSEEHAYPSWEEEDEITQSKTKGAYWCEGCYTWQLPVGHERHVENCDCHY